MSQNLMALVLCSTVIALVRGIPEGRIFNGMDAMEGQFPYQVSLKRNNGHYCGGSIISRNYILTAAHCAGTTENGVFYAYPPEEITVHAGSTHLLFDGVDTNAAASVVHEEYMAHPESAFNDVALLRLAEPLTFSDTIKPIELESQEIPENTPVVTSGWGDANNNGEVPLHLQWTISKSVSKEMCYNLDEWLCLAHPRNHGICYGDSGGPAVLHGKLVGITGFIAKTCGDDVPDGYAKVSYHLDWIRKHSDVDNMEYL